MDTSISSFDCQFRIKAAVHTASKPALHSQGNILDFMSET